MNETAEKALAFLLVGVFIMFIFYCLTSQLGMAPQPMTDVATWLSDNTLTFTIAFCFLLGCYVVLKIKKRGEYSQGE